MVSLSGYRPILNSNKKLKDDEIAITLSGLRPGEKLYEELAYSSNLIGTVHPRINTTSESTLKLDELQKLLALIRNSIRDGDYQALYETISKVADGVSDFAQSNDVFIDHDVNKSDKVLSLDFGKKN